MEVGTHSRQRMQRTWISLAFDTLDLLVILFSTARMFHELMSRDHENQRASGQPQGVGFEVYLNGTSQGPTTEDARKDGHILRRSKRFIKHPG